jgi:hypothetical protein
MFDYEQFLVCLVLADIVRGRHTPGEFRIISLAHAVVRANRYRGPQGRIGLTNWK